MPTVIDLCLSIFDWAKFRRTKGAIKLHLLLDHDGYLPCYGVLTDGKTPEIRVARTLEWPPGSIVVMDRGYLDYRFLDSLEDRGVFFVTRLKERALYSVEAEFSAPKGPILADQMICLPGRGKNAKALRLFRRVVVWDEAGEREIVLLTNNVQLAASTIAAIYKSRWQIELFFKALKQNSRSRPSWAPPPMPCAFRCGQHLSPSWCSSICKCAVDSPGVSLIFWLFCGSISLSIVISGPGWTNPLPRPHNLLSSRKPPWPFE